MAALVVAAGLAIVSYWLFFSWAQGGGSDQRQRRSQLLPQALSSQHLPLQTAASLEQPLFAGRVVEGGNVGPHLLAVHGQVQLLAEGHDAVEGA